MRVLGGEHRDIGLLEHALGCRAVVRCERNPDAGVDAKTHALELKRLPQGLAYTLGHVGGPTQIDEWREHEAELITTQTRHGGGGFGCRGEPRTELTQHVIADVMSEAVVDLFEAIKIDHEHGEAMRGWAWLEAHDEALEKQPAVWQAGQLVGARLASALRERTQLPK